MENWYNKLLEYTKEDFEKAEERNSWNEDIYCNSIVLIPTEDIHDSGFLVMDFIALDENNDIICRCYGGDVLDINGIGGYGEYNSIAYKYSMEMFNDKSLTPRSPWTMDLLPCGYFRLMNHGGKIKIGPSLSDTEIFAKDYYVESK